MSDDKSLKCARQVADLQALLIEVTQQRADLQAELAGLRELYADRERDLAFEFQRANAAEAAAQAQSEDVQRDWLSPFEAAGLRSKVTGYQDAASIMATENARLLHGLRAAKLAASSQAASLSNSFTARGAWHNLAEQLQAVIDGPAYVAPAVRYDAALAARAGGRPESEGQP